MRRREFLAAGVALNLASAAIALADQAEPTRGGGARTGTGAPGAAGGRGAVPKRIAKTTKMFKSPGMYHGKTRNLLLTADFEKGSSDPHGLVWRDGHLVSCDAGLHPGWNWQNGDESPTSGYIFSIEIV